MLINLLPQISTEPHQSLSVSHPATHTPLVWIALGFIGCYLMGGITSADKKQDDPKGHTICYFPVGGEKKRKSLNMALGNENIVALS